MELVEMSASDALDGSSTRHVSVMDMGAIKAPVIRTYLKIV
jgi:hypothetical protein